MEKAEVRANWQDLGQGYRSGSDNFLTLMKDPLR